jgi:hypothetical protein
VFIIPSGKANSIKLKGGMKMKFRKLIITLAVVVSITIPATVFAATSSTTTITVKSISGFFGFRVDTSKLTDAQKAEVSTYTQKLANLQKEFINKMVSNGTLTKEQGTEAIKRIDNALAKGMFSPDITGGKGHRRKIDGELNKFRINQTTLTDKQKADFKETYIKMIDNKKQLINNLVAANLITKVQGNNETKRIERQATKDNIGFGKCVGFMHMNRFGLDQSKLTTEQKMYFTDFNKRALDLQKELVNKAMTNGLLTKTQADSMLLWIQNIPVDFNSTSENFSKVRSEKE